VTLGRYTVSVYNQPLRPTQPPNLSDMENDYRSALRDWEGNRWSGVALAMRHSLRYIHLYPLENQVQAGYDSL